MIKRALALVAALALAAEPAPAAHGGYGSTSPSYGWRAIAGPVEIPMAKDATNLQMMSRTPEFATDTITQIKVVFANWWAQNASADNVGPGASTTVTASIEYPAGTCTPLTFSTASSGMIANGGQITSDALTIAIPSGATFWVREYTSAASGGTVVGNTGASDATHYDTTDGEAVEGWASGGTDYTSSCAAYSSWSGWSGNGYGNARKPIAVIGWTQHSAVCLVGDSRTRGNADYNMGGTNVSTGPRWGQFDPWIGQTFGTINLGENGDRAKETSQNDGHFANRGALLQFCTHAVYAYGINDFNQNGTSNVTLESYFQTFQSLYDPSHSLYWYVATVFPYDSTSNPNTGVCPSVSALSSANETYRQNYNTDIRNRSFTGPDGYIDIDAIVAESPWPGFTGTFSSYASCTANTADTGELYKLTSDGLHLNAQGTAVWVPNAFNTATGSFAGVNKSKKLFCTDKAGAYRC